MHTSHWIPVALLLTLISAPAAAKKPVVAVFNMEARGVKLDEGTLQNLSDFLADRLAATGRYLVAPRDQLKKRLGQQKKKSFKACFDQSCQIELGRELAAQKSLATRVMKLGSKCIVSTTLYDLRKAATERGATADGGCDVDGITASIKAAVTKLAGKSAAPAPAPAPAPTPVPAPKSSGGTLRVEGSPAGASVAVVGALNKPPHGGRRQGRLPADLTGLKPGSYNVQVSRAGHVPYAKWVYVKAGRAVGLRVKLKKVGPTISHKKDRSTMVRVQGGSFVRGTDRGKDNVPQRKIHLDGFYIDKFEISAAQYAACVRKRGCDKPKATDDECTYSKRGKGKHPINCVSWTDASKYCAWAGKRLPTEAEWEKAARGSDGRRFPWGDKKPSCALAQSRQCKADGPLPVTAFAGAKSPCGAVQLAGNVYEYVADYYDKGYYKNSPGRNPKGPGTGRMRVMRGGSWDHREGHLQTFVRRRVKPDRPDTKVGFRCAK
jgi:formylglycine-generating enzyme required for sulfatase activity